MLDEARRSLERLMASPTSTNVSIDDKRIRGIGRVRAKWQNATRQYSQALKSIAEAITAKAKDEIDQKTKTNCQEAAETIKGLASHFQAGAFETEFRVLEQSLPDDKAERAKVKNQLLASREKALRIMRQYRTDLTKHPVLVKLTDRKTNPFLATEALSAAASIRLALKEIELQALISVEK